MCPKVNTFLLFLRNLPTTYKLFGILISQEIVTLELLIYCFCLFVFQIPSVINYVGEV